MVPFQQRPGAVTYVCFDMTVPAYLPDVCFYSYTLFIPKFLPAPTFANIPDAKCIRYAGGRSSLFNAIEENDIFRKKTKKKNTCVEVFYSLIHTVNIERTNALVKGS